VEAAYTADACFLTAGKKLVDVRHEAFRKLTSLRTRVVNYWRGLTLPYVEAGVRLIRQSDIEAFVHTLEGFRGVVAMRAAPTPLVLALMPDHPGQRRRTTRHAAVIFSRGRTRSSVVLVRRVYTKPTCELTAHR
jgi:hypothetical protein